MIKPATILNSFEKKSRPRFDLPNENKDFNLLEFLIEIRSLHNRYLVKRNWTKN